MNNQSARFIEETGQSVNRWKAHVSKEDRARMLFNKRHGYIINSYAEAIDKLTGVTKDRRFVTTPDLERCRVPVTAWNSLPAIPGPAPEWYKAKTHLSSSGDIGHGSRHDFVKLEFVISRAGSRVRYRGDTYKTLGWPVGAAS